MSPKALQTAKLSPHKLSVGLRRYFYSGWAFLIPYFAAYALYAWLKWPTNPIGTDAQIIEGPFEYIENSSASLQPPCLLHVYWTLHFAHLLLGVLALWGYRRFSDVQLSFSFHLQRFAPWFCLTLIFGIPGIYLEYPGDTWAHYARINEWGVTDWVTQHSTWTKSSYFLAYTLSTEIAFLGKLTNLNTFYTGCCLLLCWQYYRLARTANLKRNSATIFVLLLSVLLGNNTFGFFRYYGISSSIFSQIGAVAICRIVLAHLIPLGIRQISFNVNYLRDFIVKLFIPVSLLFGIISINHIQGLGIAILSVAAIGAWNLSQMKSIVVWISIFCLIGFNLAAVGLRSGTEPLASIVSMATWFNHWYGFNLFSPSTQAFVRTAEIVGFIGSLNLVAGVLLIRRNHIIAWLTLFPLFALAMPMVAVPLASLLSHHNADSENILTFHRMLFAIPPGLALVAFTTYILDSRKYRDRYRSKTTNQPLTPVGGLSSLSLKLRTNLSMLVVILALLILVVTPPAWPSYNRLYHTLVRTPDDLNLQLSLDKISAISPGIPRPSSSQSLAIAQQVYASRDGTDDHSDGNFRVISYGKANSELTHDPLEFLKHFPHSIIIPSSGTELFTPASQIGSISRHWLPQRTAIARMGGPEILNAAAKLGYEASTAGTITIYLHTSSFIPSQTGQ